MSMGGRKLNGLQVKQPDQAPCMDFHFSHGTADSTTDCFQYIAPVIIMKWSARGLLAGTGCSRSAYVPLLTMPA